MLITVIKWWSARKTSLFGVDSVKPPRPDVGNFAYNESNEKSGC